MQKQATLRRSTEWLMTVPILLGTVSREDEGRFGIQQAPASPRRASEYHFFWSSGITLVSWGSRSAEWDRIGESTDLAPAASHLLSGIRTGPVRLPMMRHVGQVLVRNGAKTRIWAWRWNLENAPIAIGAGLLDGAGTIGVQHT